MPREPRYMNRKYMEPNHSQLLNWERKGDRREFSDYLAYTGIRYHGHSTTVIRNPSMKPLLHRGKKP